MIRSSVNLDCFISVSLKVTDSTQFWRKFRRSGQICNIPIASFYRDVPHVHPPSVPLLRQPVKAPNVARPFTLR